LFKQAYLASEAPELLFNIAQAYRLKGAGNCRLALQFYENYLRADPKTRKKKSVEAAIRDMEGCARDEPPPAAEGQETPAPAPEKSPPVRSTPESSPRAPPEERSSGSSTWLAPVLGIGGLSLAAAGGGLFVWSRIRYDSIESSGCAPSCDSDTVGPPRTAQFVGVVLMAAGGAAATVGLVLWLSEPKSKERAAWVRARGSGVEAGLRF